MCLGPSAGAATPATQLRIHHRLSGSQALPGSNVECDLKKTETHKNWMALWCFNVFCTPLNSTKSRQIDEARNCLKPPTSQHEMVASELGGFRCPSRSRTLCFWFSLLRCRDTEILEADPAILPLSVKSAARMGQ